MRIHTPAEVGLLARDVRRRRGWSQTQLAEAVGATRQWVRLLESGKPRLELGLTLRALIALGIVLDVTAPDVPAANATARTRGARSDRKHEQER